MSNWGLPPGCSDLDRSAPWNQPEPRCDECRRLTVDCDCLARVEGDLRRVLEALVDAYVTVPSGGPTVSRMIACVTDEQHAAWMRAWTLVAPPEEVDRAWRAWVDETTTADDLERLMAETPPASADQERYARDRFGAIARAAVAT